MNTEPQRVYVELSWYDGPRDGVVDLNGHPHRFSSKFDEEDSEWMGTFVLWPINDDELALEVEQWQIFVAWNKRYESGVADTSSHPATGGISNRYDELDALVKEKRTDIPSDALVAKGEYVRIDQEVRYEDSGPDYAIKWTVLSL